MPLDLTGQYNTQLTPAQEARFEHWVIENGKQKELFDYDLRGAWLNGAAKSANGHLPDTYKKPNHPTFSTESQYSDSDNPGGEWVKNGDKWTFKASPANITQHGAEGLQQYFQQVEPDSELVLPAEVQ